MPEEFYNFKADGKFLKGVDYYRIKHKQNYCEHVDLYNFYNPENLFENMNFISDYSEDGILNILEVHISFLESLIREEVMRKIGQDVMPGVEMGATENRRV